LTGRCSSGGGTIHVIDVPADVEKIEDVNEFHRRIKGHMGGKKGKKCISGSTNMGQLVTAIVALFATLAMPFAAAQGQDRTITVFAAASMKNALDDINEAFTRNTGIKVTASYAASSALIKEIEQGAPADVFASADLDWMDYGSQKKVIKNKTRINLLG
jgi:ABC-type molybdate transport system substrate-binding protein